VTSPITTIDANGRCKSSIVLEIPVALHLA